MRRSLLTLSLLMTVLPPEAPAGILHRNRTRNNAPRSAQRRRLHSDDLIADPGTVEIDLGGFFASDHLAAPLALKWTPGGVTAFWQRTELSASFDSVAGTATSGGRWVTQFSDRLGFAVTHVLLQTENLSLALAPQAAFLLRGDHGARAGMGALAKYDIGLNTLAGSVTWTGATHASDTNPAGDWETGGTFVRRISSKLSGYTSLFAERPTAGDNALAHSIGCLYTRSYAFQLDFTFRRIKTTGQPFDNQGVVTATFVLGRPREKK